MTMDQLNESELAKEVSKYAVVFGFLLVAICVMPCIAFALLSKYCQKQPLKRKVGEQSYHTVCLPTASLEGRVYGNQEPPERVENKTGINCQTGNESQLDRRLVAG